MPSVTADEESSSVVVVTPVEGSVQGDAAEEVKAGPAAKADEKPSKEGEDKAKAKDAESASSSDEKTDGKKEDEEKEKEKVIVGMMCDKKDLYQKWDKHNRFTWSEEYPDDLEEAAENEQTMKYAILVRNKKSYDSRKKVEIDSIVIQSPLLKRVLRDVLKDYPGVTTTLQRLSFSAPFKPFVHRWAELRGALESDEYDEATKEHVRLLHGVLSEELKDVISAVEDYIKNRVVTYEHVWTIFQPGCTVLSSRYGRAAAVRLEEGQYIEHCKLGPCFQLKGDRVDWDGAKFGYDQALNFIVPFVGTVPITQLDSYPLAFHEDAAAVRATLLARGRLFEQLAGYHYKMYRGQAIEQKEWGPAKTTVDSRVVVDAHAHGKFNPNELRQLRPLKKVDAVRSVQASADSEDDFGSNRNGLGLPDFCFDPYAQTADEGEALFRNEGKPAVPLTEEELVLATPIVKGYALKPKKWLEFFVDDVSDVAFNERAFDSLVLPAGHKQLVLAFAQSQVRFKDRFDDVISGKGRGIIMLLSGGPGIGKTLTAESVAEAMRVPLYVMSAGDLGASSWDVEQNLARVLEMVAKWDAVLLLDECDVFLEARTASDLDRNRVVSIFLRTLEYYEGILFLTTNRVEHVDDAFHSRIHISLAYPPLDEAARRQVWAGFLEHGGAGADADASAPGKHCLTAGDVDRLARLDLNGRQIKNVLKTSHLLACHLGETLAYSHLRTVLSVEGFELGEE